MSRQYRRDLGLTMVPFFLAIAAALTTTPTTAQPTPGTPNVVVYESPT